MSNSPNWSNFNWKISKYFSVGEVLQWDKQRIPTDPTIIKNIFLLAKELDKVREAWGSPILITSWYRPPAINHQIGGASKSQHLYGLAADITTQNKDPHFESWLDARWFGALGYGQRAKRGFTHVDMRNGKGWMSGGGKGFRWNY